MVEPVTPLTPRPLRFASVGQWWREVTFVHWAVAPETVAHLLPRGIPPDTFDGLTYVGLVPFLMHPIGGQFGPRLPYVGTFCETNVRPYSVDGHGRRERVAASRMTWALVRERSNDHPPWLLREAELIEIDAGVVAAAGLGDPTGPPASVLHSPGVPVRFGLPSAVGK